MKLPVLLPLLCSLALGAEPLRMSVFAVAGDVRQYLLTPEGRERVATKLERMHVTGIFLEGRRGDDYVSIEEMKPVRDFFKARGFRVSGGIATVPGNVWGVRQNGPYGWLNYQAEKTQRDIKAFFSENAKLFDEIVIDDFYCFEDTTPESDKARGTRSWGEYRRDLLVSLMEPMIFAPARASRPDVKIILKYPQWYDRFHLFGYDPARMSPAFSRIWVGTEVRNPATRRMGFVQPTEGYMNFRWLSSVPGAKVEGAWFDHYDCTAQNFIDQAWQSVLAGAKELTFFHLGDLVEGHPGHELLERDWPALQQLHERVGANPLSGIAFYKPVNGDSDDNMWLMDYLGMLGLPIKPESAYPAQAKVAILGVQASGDPQLLEKMRQHLSTGATLVLTPALLRKLGPEGAKLAGASASALEQAKASKITEQALSTPIEIDLSLQAPAKNVVLWATTGAGQVPYLTSFRSGRGTVMVWNARTFNEIDYLKTKERLLAPEKLGLPVLPEPLLNQIRNRLGVPLEAPAGVAYYEFGTGQAFYNFLDYPVEVRLSGSVVSVKANGLTWR